MPAPNLLIVGSQKCGTTWTHANLQKSRHVFASAPKEMNFFNVLEKDRSWDDYLAHFPETPGVRYYLESTPHYFQLPVDGHDMAADIRRTLGTPKLIVIFRNPVDRYESAYTHNMDKNRIPYAPVIRDMTPEFSLLALGNYGSILRHWRTHFPEIGVFFYDDLQADRLRFLDSVMSFLGVENDLSLGDLDGRRNEKRRKARIGHPDWKQMPVLAPDLADRLLAFYQDEITLLESLTGRDLSAWRHPRKTRFLRDTVGPTVARYIRRATKGRWV